MLRLVPDREKLRCPQCGVALSLTDLGDKCPGCGGDTRRLYRYSLQCFGVALTPFGVGMAAGMSGGLLGWMLWDWSNGPALLGAGLVTSSPAAFVLAGLLIGTGVGTGLSRHAAIQDRWRIQTAAVTLFFAVMTAAVTYSAARPWWPVAALAGGMVGTVVARRLMAEACRDAPSALNPVDSRWPSEMAAWLEGADERPPAKPDE